LRYYLNPRGNACRSKTRFKEKLHLDTNKDIGLVIFSLFFFKGSTGLHCHMCPLLSLITVQGCIYFATRSVDIVYRQEYLSDKEASMTATIEAPTTWDVRAEEMARRYTRR
jgi:hypothetical protein